MSQNIYDDDGFFEGYARLDRSVRGLAGAPEWPSLRALLPEKMAGLCVLDLGCGFGWFCRWARKNGAAEVLGVDLSENMLARARASTDDAAIVYRRADLEHLELAEEGALDLAFSSLTLHYLERLDQLVRLVKRALRPGGQFVFSVEHPIFTAPSRPGWVRAEPGDGGEERQTWPVDRYLDEGPRITNWLAEGVIKRHRTLGTYLNMLIAAGFSVTHVEEWGPSAAQIEARPELAIERERPAFLLVSASRA